MAVTASVRLQILLSGLLSGSRTIEPLAIASAAAIGSENTTLRLAAADNQIAVPVGSTSWLFIPPAGNLFALELRAVLGQTGTLLHKTQWSLISLDPSVTFLLVNAAGIVTPCTSIFI